MSGGKDGFWQVQTALEHGLHPLCVTYHVPFRNELGERNLRKLVDLGVDHIDFRPNPLVERAFIRKAFIRTAISGLVPHMAIFSLPVQVAVAHDIPLVIYAENSKRIAEQYGFESRDEGPLVGHYSYANIDDELLGIHHHAKWYKFGITRSWDTVSMEIRNGRVTREEAISLLRESGAEIPWDAIELFCNYVGLSQAEYFSILENFRNPEIWSRRDGKWIIEGFLIDPFDWPEDSEAS